MTLGSINLSIRGRIALSIFAVSAGMLVLMSAVVYITFDRQLTASLDDTLRLRAESSRQLVDITGNVPSLAESLDPGDELATGEAVLRLYDSRGEMLDDASPASGTTAEEQRVVMEVLDGGHSLYRSISLDDDEDYRILVDPIESNGNIVGFLVTGIERSRVSQPLAILRIILVVAGMITAAALALGSYFVARRALRPVRAMTEAAVRITEGDLHERVGGADANDELGHLASTFNTMISRLSDTIDRERRFTADASHELRTPLAAIAAGIDVTLAQSRDASEYRRVLSMVRGQTRQLHGLANNLLLLARLDDEAMRDRFATVELGGLVDAAVQSLEARHPTVPVRFEPPVEMLEVQGDYELLGRLVLNLLENAVSHAGHPVSIDIELSKTANGDAVLAVEDSGPGLPDDLAQEVFQRFRRGDQVRSGEGTGLGLAIVASIARVHGGTIHVASPRRGKGARFELVLPLIPAR